MGDAVEDYVRLGNEVASYFTPNPKYEVSSSLRSQHDFYLWL
jgi:hypothetical protein